MHKSFWPRNNRSTPFTAAISSMFLMQSAVSTCSATMVFSLALPAYPSRPARFMLRCGKYTERVPAVG